jgi:hypothetical protein
MIKKIAIGLIFTLITSVLVVGAVNRTNAKAEQYAPSEAVAQNGNGGGQNLDGDRQYPNEHDPLYLEKEQTGQVGQEQSGQGQENGRYANTESTNETTNDMTTNEVNTDEVSPPLGGQGQGYQGGSGQNGQNNIVCDGDCDTQPLNQTLHNDLLTYQGIVSTAPAASVELVIDTVDGPQTIATGPAQWLESSIMLVSGDNVTVTGFWENGEFKATAITRSSDNFTVTLRDELGRPLWSGSVRNTTNGQGQGQDRGQGQGNGNQNSGG